MPICSNYVFLFKAPELTYLKLYVLLQTAFHTKPTNTFGKPCSEDYTKPNMFHAIYLIAINERYKKYYIFHLRAVYHFHPHPFDLLNAHCCLKHHFLASTKAYCHMSADRS